MHPAARDTLVGALTQGWADPARLYTEGRRARQLLDLARATLAGGLGVAPQQLSFHPGGPAAARRAAEGMLYAARHRSQRAVLTAVEHSSLLQPARARSLQAQDPRLCAVARVDSLGRVELAHLEQLLAEAPAAFVAVQSANGEVGTTQPLDAAHALARACSVPLLVDAQAGLGRAPVPHDWDVLVGDARSWGGPGGLGVLAVRPHVRWAMPGLTLDVEAGRAEEPPWVPLALAAAEAWQQTAADRAADAALARELVERLRAAAAAVPDTEVVGDPVDRLPHIVTFSCLYVDGESLVGELDRAGFAVASGSACTSALLEPSHVLGAMGVLTHGNVRVTLPPPSLAPSLAEDVHAFCAALPQAVRTVRARLGVAGL